MKNTTKKKIPTADDIAEMHHHIRQWLVSRLGDAGQRVRILYGGSVKPANAAEILAPLPPGQARAKIVRALRVNSSWIVNGRSAGRTAVRVFSNPASYVPTNSLTFVSGRSGEHSDTTVGD